jgi:hypothetical protein
MPRYLVAELQSDGHHARYLRWVIESESLQDSELIVAGPRSLFEHSELASMQGRIVPIEIEIDSATASLVNNFSVPGLLRKHLAFRSRYIEALRRAQERGKVDLILIPYVDHTLYTWSTLGTGFGNTPWVGISMLPMFHLPKIKNMVVPKRSADWMREKLYRRLLRDRNLKMLFTIDPEMIEFASTNFSAEERSRLKYLPDPSVQYELLPRNSSRAELGIPQNAYLVVLYGALHPRKGIEQLIRGANAPSCPSTVHVLLAGRQDNEVREILQSHDANELKTSGRLHVFDKYIDDRHEKLILSSADCMWIGYVRFYRMSGILVLAARHALTCIFTREGLIGHLGRKFNLGPEIDPDRISTVTSALAELANQPGKYSDSIALAKEYFEIHSIKHLQASLGEVIASTSNFRNG